MMATNGVTLPFGLLHNISPPTTGILFFRSNSIEESILLNAPGRTHGWRVGSVVRLHSLLPLLGVKNQVFRKFFLRDIMCQCVLVQDFCGSNWVVGGLLGEGREFLGELGVDRGLGVGDGLGR